MHTSDSQGTIPGDAGPGRGPVRLRTPVLRPRPHAALRYGATLAGLAVASVVTYLFADQFSRTLFILFWPVVIGAAWFGGIGVAALASVLSVLIVDYLLIPPYRQVGFNATDDLFPLLVFLLVSATIGYLVDAAHRNSERVSRLAIENADYARRAEESAHYLGLATTTLASSLDYEDTLARLASVLVPELGDWCAVHLCEDGVIRQVAVAHVDPAKIEFAREMNERYPTPPDSLAGVPNVMRTGRPEVYSDISEDMLIANARDADHLRITRALNIRSAIVAPLATGDEVIGAITLIAAESGRRYTEADLPLIMEVARRATLAVENARHHRSAIEAKERAEELQQEAETANIAKTQFLTSMSHELRTPLNAIAGYADLMSLGIHGVVTEAQAEDLERIKRNQRHLLGIINDILNFARLDAGRVEYNISNVPAYDVVDDLHPMIRPQIAGRELRFTCDTISRDIEVRADREKLRQVLLNLLSNAVKFTAPGGAVRLHCHADAHVVEFVVEDTGVGIPREKLGSIFEPFVQVNRSLAQPVEGTGLGLAISRDMVEGMAGTLTVSSEPGRGSSFKVTLPRAQ